MRRAAAVTSLSRVPVSHEKSLAKCLRCHCYSLALHSPTFFPLSLTLSLPLPLYPSYPYPRAAPAWGSTRDATRFSRTSSRARASQVGSRWWLPRQPPRFEREQVGGHSGSRCGGSSLAMLYHPPVCACVVLLGAASQLFNADL